jgi:hypothetical protein
MAIATGVMRVEANSRDVTSTAPFAWVTKLDQTAARARASRAQPGCSAPAYIGRVADLNTLTSMLGQAGDTGGQQVTVKAADPAKIGYIYDWNSIFANPSQEKMFASPFAQGGLVDGSDDVNEELLKILKG